VSRRTGSRSHEARADDRPRAGRPPASGSSRRSTARTWSARTPRLPSTVHSVITNVSGRAGLRNRARGYSPLRREASRASAASARSAPASRRSAAAASRSLSASRRASRSWSVISSSPPATRSRLAACPSRLSAATSRSCARSSRPAGRTPKALATRSGSYPNAAARSTMSDAPASRAAAWLSSSGAPDGLSRLSSVTDASLPEFVAARLPRQTCPAGVTIRSAPRRTAGSAPRFRGSLTTCADSTAKTTSPRTMDPRPPKPF